MSEKHLTVLVVPHDEGNVRRLRVSYRALKLMLPLAAVVVAGALTAFLTYGRVAARATRVEILERENERLEAENAKVDRLAANLESAERAYQQIRTMAGLPARPEEDRPGGIDRVAELSPVASGSATAPREEGGRGAPAATGKPDVPSAWPLTIQGFVTARFTGLDGHPGIDVAVPENTPVVATAVGVVRQKGFDPLYGHFVVLDHEDDFQTMYAHNAVVLVERGERVGRGETIAYSGNSGRSTAPHLHYEVRRNGTAVDPSPYLP